MKKHLILLVLIFTMSESIKCIAQKIDLTGFLPEGYVVSNEVYGDLNKDGSEDCVVIIKEADINKIVVDENRGELDRNRRGILILFKFNDSYELAAKNYNCFSSENEDGGVYFPPDLYFNVQKGNLYINYDNGRYGNYSYTFRFQNADFELIGYDQSDNFGPVVHMKTSINFLTKKKLIKENINRQEEGADEIFKETWSKINVKNLIKLSGIEDFDNLDLSIY